MQLNDYIYNEYKMAQMGLFASLSRYFGRWADYMTLRRHPQAAVSQHPDAAGMQRRRRRSDNDIRKTLRRFFYSIGIMTLLLLGLVLFFFYETAGARGLAFACFNVMAVIGAYFLSGCAMGFIFAIPKSAQGTPPIMPKDQGNAGAASAQAGDYKDNTSLEEISDWITKIIIGLSLTQFEKLQAMIQEAANSIARTLSSVSGHPAAGFVVFGYSCILLYAVGGLIIGYLWTRIDFRKILYQNKKDIEQINRLQEEKAQLRVENIRLEGQKSAMEEEKNKLEQKARSILSAVNNPQIPMMRELELQHAPELQDEELRVLVRKISDRRPVIHKSDLHKGRWGGKSLDQNRQLSAEVSVSHMPGLYKVRIRVSATGDESLQGPVAILLHDSFNPMVRLLRADGQQQVELDVIAYEAFTVAALTDIHSETHFIALELDLNEVTGYPPGFYWG